MELLEESGIAEIEVKEGEESIKLSRNIIFHEHAGPTNHSTTCSKQSTSYNQQQLPIWGKRC